MTMTLERFSDLTEAYGADLRRWPVAERAAAEALMTRDARARLLREEADVLDSLLDAVAHPVVSSLMVERAVAGSASAGLKRRASWRLWSRLAWLSGAGWAAAAFAGVAFGFSLTGSLTQDLRADAVFYQASLSGADDAEVLGE